MADIALNIRANGGTAAATELAKLDAEQIKLVMAVLRLSTEYKRAEAAAARASAAMTQSARNAGRALNEQERAAHRANAATSRSVTIHHGQGYAMSQTMRQMVKRRTWKEEPSAAAMIDQAEDMQFRRWLKSQQIHKQRRSARVRQAAVAQSGMDGIVGSAMATLHGQWLTDRAPKLIGSTAIGFSRGGGAFDGEDQLMTRARRTVARNLERMPELFGKVTAAEFDTMSRKMRDQMEKKLSSGIGFGGMAMTAGISAMLVKSVTSLVSDDLFNREKGASTRMVASASSRRELRQIVDTGRDYSFLLKAMDVTSAAGGYSEQESGKIIFAAQSAGFDVSKIPQFAANMKRLAMDPTPALNAAQKIRDNYGDSAGNLDQIVDKLLIAAGPSPASVNEIAAGVGSSAAAFRAIGGSADEQMATLGVLSTRLKSPEAASEYLKSVSNQLQKKSGRIRWGVNEKPLEGIDLITALPRLQRNNMLLNDQGNPVSSSDFLGEMMAQNAADQILQAQGAIRGATGQMRKAKADPGSVARRRGSLFDLKADSGEYLEKMQRQRALKEEQQLGPLFTLAEAVAERELKDATGDGQRTQLVGIKEKFKTANRSLWTNSSQESFVNERLRSNSLTKDEERLYFATILQDQTTGTLEHLAKSKQMYFQQDGSIGTKERKGRLVLDRSTDKGDWLNYELTRSQMDNYRYAAQQQLRLRTEGLAKPQRGLVQQVNGFMAAALDAGAGYVPRNLKGFIAQGKAVGNSFNTIVPSYMESSGLPADDYRVQAMQKLVDERKSNALQKITAEGMKMGGDFDRVRKEIMASAAGIPAQQLQDVYSRNVAYIDNAIIEAEKGTVGGTEASRDYARTRVESIRDMRNQFLRDDGRMSAVEAQAGRDFVAGSDPAAETQKALLEAVRGIGNTLNRLAEKLPEPLPIKPVSGAQPPQITQ